MKIDVKNIQWNAVASIREMVIWGLILCVVLFFGAKQFFSPLSKKVETAKSQLLAKQMELEAYKKFLKGGNAANKKSLEGMDVNRQAMAQKVKDAFGNVNMSPDVVVSEILSALTNPAYAKAALLEKFNFIGEKKQAGYSEMNLDLKLTGTYNGIAQYLEFIKKLPYLLRIESISIRNKDGQNSQGKVEIAAKAVLYVGEPKAMEAIAQANSNSDMATDLLVEITGGKIANTPFSAKPREMTNWSVHELKLTSTMAGGARPTALINGKVFTLGEEIADFRIVEVKQREVILERGDVRHVLRIDENEMPGSEDKTVLTQANESSPAGNPSAASGVPPVLSQTPSSEAEGAIAKDSATGTGAAPKNDAAVSSEEAISGQGQGGGGSGEKKNDNPSSLAMKEGSGSGSGAAEQIPDGYTAEEWARQKANPHGTLSGVDSSTPQEEVEAQAEEKTDTPSDEGNPKKVRLDPNLVEDVEGVPFDDLQEVTLVDLEG